MNYLENINPSYFEVLYPLTKWKILSIKDLKEEVEYNGSLSGFYKIISKLEKNLLIDSFINTWTNKKYIYLMPSAIKALGENISTLNINRDIRFHDSIVTSITRKFNTYPFIEEVFLDFQTREKFPLLERVPDSLLIGKLGRSFNIAIEVELTQKSSDRVKEIIRTYSSSKVVNQALYITDKKSILNAYQKYLNELGEEISKEKILIMYMKDMAKGKVEIMNSPVLFKDKVTTLKELFGTA